MHRPDRSTFSKFKITRIWWNVFRCILTQEEKKRLAQHPNRWSWEFHAGPAGKASPQSSSKRYFLDLIGNRNSIAIFRRKTRTFLTGEGSWLSSKRRLGLWWLLTRKTWSSGANCGGWLSAVMLLSRLLTRVIRCSLGLSRFGYFHSSTPSS